MCCALHLHGFGLQAVIGVVQLIMAPEVIASAALGTGIYFTARCIRIIGVVVYQKVWLLRTLKINIHYYTVIVYLTVYVYSMHMRPPTPGRPSCFPPCVAPRFSEVGCRLCSHTPFAHTACFTPASPTSARGTKQHQFGEGQIHGSSEWVCRIVLPCGRRWQRLSRLINGI